jgi:hypothetical protein
MTFVLVGVTIEPRVHEKFFMHDYNNDNDDENDNENDDNDDGEDQDHALLQQSSSDHTSNQLFIVPITPDTDQSFESADRLVRVSARAGGDVLVVVHRIRNNNNHNDGYGDDGDDGDEGDNGGRPMDLADRVFGAVRIQNAANAPNSVLTLTMDFDFGTDSDEHGCVITARISVVQLANEPLLARAVDLSSETRAEFERMRDTYTDNEGGDGDSSRLWQMSVVCDELNAEDRDDACTLVGVDESLTGEFRNRSLVLGTDRRVNRWAIGRGDVGVSSETVHNRYDGCFFRAGVSVPADFQCSQVLVQAKALAADHLYGHMRALFAPFAAEQTIVPLANGSWRVLRATSSNNTVASPPTTTTTVQTMPSFVLFGCELADGECFVTLWRAEAVNALRVLLTHVVDRILDAAQLRLDLVSARAAVQSVVPRAFCSSVNNFDGGRGVDRAIAAHILRRGGSVSVAALAFLTPIVALIATELRCIAGSSAIDNARGDVRFGDVVAVVALDSGMRELFAPEFPDRWLNNECRGEVIEDLLARKVFRIQEEATDDQASNVAQQAAVVESDALVQLAERSSAALLAALTTLGVLRDRDSAAALWAAVVVDDVAAVRAAMASRATQQLLDLNQPFVVDPRDIRAHWPLNALVCALENRSASIVRILVDAVKQTESLGAWLAVTDQVRLAAPHEDALAPIELSDLVSLATFLTNDIEFVRQNLLMQ